MRFGKYLYGSGCLFVLGIVYGTMGSDSAPVLTWWLALFLLGIGLLHLMVQVCRCVPPLSRSCARTPS